MAGRSKFSDLSKKLTPEARARIDHRKAALKAEMHLDELRKALGLTQQELALAMDIGQPAVAKFEGRKDMLVSSLRNAVEAMGGSLKIVASYPDSEVVISNFGERD